jgi:hypothetical protein
MDDSDQKPVPVFTEQELKIRRARAVALAWVLAALVVLFFAVTIVKLGPNVLNRPL